MKTTDKIFVAGHRGLAGSAIVRGLQKAGFNNLVLKTRDELDLMDAGAVSAFFTTEGPQYVFFAAAKVGGIQANTKFPADFFRENIIMQTNVIDAAYRSGVGKFLFLGSSCIYPRSAPQPMKEEYLMTGHLEETNRGYAAAKVAGIEMCLAYRRQFGCNFISIVPTNLYGPGDHFTDDRAHVIPALMNRFHDAKISKIPTVEVWGSGSPKREFLYVDDMAEAAIFLMNTYDSPDTINVGTGEDVSIKETAELMKEIVGYPGDIVWDTSRPDGMPRKLLDISKIRALGWRHKTSLEEGLKKTYEWYCKQDI